MTPAAPHVELNAAVEQRECAQHNRANSFASPFPKARQKNERQAGGLATIGSLLPHIGITKQALKKLEAIQLVREKRENRCQEISYNARPFVLCGLPLRQPPKDQLIYTRRNGNFLLEITAHPRSGLPCGQDRLIPIWLATLALQQKSPTLHFDSPSQLLDYFRLRKDGSQYRRMKAAFQRVFAATIFFGSEDLLKKHLVVDWTRFHFLDEMQLWFNREDGVQPVAQETPCNVVVLSDAFNRELVGHPIPVERDVVAALAHTPGLLDFYISLKNKPGCQLGPRMPLAPMTQSPAAPSSVCWRSCTHLGHRNPVAARNATTPLRRLAHRISAYCDAHPSTLGGETTHHVTHFFLELRIVVKLKLFHAMGLNVMTLPEAVYHHARNPQVPS
jgi:hypothetical protein